MVRDRLTRERLHQLLKELARTSPQQGSYQVYLVGGGTAVYSGWRASSIDVDLFSEQEDVFRDIQGIKERMNINIEFARPEHFVPALSDSDQRHVFIEEQGRVSLYHYDPYAQIFSKIVRGFDRDLLDARHFIESGMVEPQRLRSLVDSISAHAYSKYPSLTPTAVAEAVKGFLELAP